MFPKQLHFPLTYTDNNGTDHCTVLSDGYSLQFTLRGISFIGTSFNLLSFSSSDSQLVKMRFNIDEYETLQGIFVVELPLPILWYQQETIATLKLMFDYRNDPNSIRYVYYYQEHIITSEKQFVFVEDLLLDIQKKLPPNSQLHCCMTCRYSHYHPVGNNDFGGLACFKLLSKEAEKVHDKLTVMALFEQSADEHKLHIVQETFLCSIYQPIDGHWCYKSF